MVGDYMRTKYNTNVSNKLTSEYLDCLINRIYALLPKYEELNFTNIDKKSFITYQSSLIQTINGNTDLLQYNNCIVLDVLSHLECLKSLDNHDDYKRHILKICNLLTKLKMEVMNNGI
jgi:hypothetical protein